jgi:hypothetical protein
MRESVTAAMWKSNGEDNLKPLAARHGRGMARHGRGMGNAWYV